MKRKKQCIKCPHYLQAIGYCTYGEEPMAIAEHPGCPIIMQELKRECAEHHERLNEVKRAYAEKIYKDIVQPWLEQSEYEVDWLPDGRPIFIDQAGNEFGMYDLRKDEDYWEMSDYLLQATKGTDLCPNQYPHPLYWVLSDAVRWRR